jgi:integrase
MANQDRFKQWLERNHYRAATIKSTLRDMRRIREYWSEEGELEELPESVYASLRRYATYIEEMGIEGDFAAFVRRQDVGTIERKPKAKPRRRVHEAKAFDPDDMRRLVAVLQGSEDPRDQVLLVLSTTGLRIGDVLRATRDVIRDGLRAGVIQIERKGGTFQQVPLGVREPWDALYEGMKRDKAKPVNVAEYVAKGNPDPEASSGAAYPRVKRRLQFWGRELPLQGRVHLHRLRRTMAVYALRTTQDTSAVQQMLGHASINSTMKYLDEVRTEDVSALQKKLSGLMGGGKS